MYITSSDFKCCNIHTYRKGRHMMSGQFFFLYEIHVKYLCCLLQEDKYLFITLIGLGRREVSEK